jgi:prepilin-type processing-associated H-X9-DG protein
VDAHRGAALDPDQDHVVAPADMIAIADSMPQPGYEYIYAFLLSINSHPNPERHNGGSNFTFVDGHSEWVARENFCRGCPTSPGTESDSTSLSGDFQKGKKVHWFPYANAPT